MGVIGITICSRSLPFATIPQIFVDHFVGKMNGGRPLMARTFHRLTARVVATASKPGMYADGAGLYLRVARAGGKSWVLRFMLDGKAREMGLGGVTKVGLADARKKAAEQRLLLADRIDPIVRRKGEHGAK